MTKEGIWPKSIFGQILSARGGFAARSASGTYVRSSMTSSVHPAYRPDIDGLRAVAVLSVVGFHAFPGSFRGGFVGVDVFFVISGFLISKILFENLDRGTFSFGEFYGRRVKRIFPALAVVLLACAVAGWLVLLPIEYAQLGKHIAGGAGFVANLVLLSESGYFDAGAVTKPLLHLWSLGIEEQFYFVWPILLYAARKRSKAPLLAAVFVASFALNMVLVTSHREATFYSPLSRFWELLTGSALAYASGRNARWLRAAAPVRNLMSLSGAALIAFAVWSFHSEAPFPGWRALLPTVGACLVIAAGSDAWTNRKALSHPWAVWIGLISFPLYLWHWPLLTFAAILEGATPSPKIRLAAVALSFVLAWATFRYVERPIRVGRPNAKTVPFLLSSIAVLFVVGLWIAFKGGFSDARGPWNVENISQSYTKNDQFDEACRNAEAARFAPAFDPTLDFCRATANTKTFDIVVVGDSHAGRIESGLRETTTRPLLNLGRGSCLPLFGYEATNPGSEKIFDCSPTMGRLLERAIEISPRVIVVSGFFARPYDGRVTLHSSLPMGTLMRDTLARLSAGVPRVVVVLDVPELPFEPSYCVDRPIHRGRDRGQCGFAKEQPLRQLALYEADLRAAAQNLPNVSFFDPADVLCDRANCYAVKDKRLLYDDRHHLSRYGASLVGTALTSRLQ